MDIVRVTKTEFELENGSVYPIDPPLTQEITIEEFQEHYDFATQVVKSGRDVGGDDPDLEKLGQCRED
jgi:hypothetical protein